MVRRACRCCGFFKFGQSASGRNHRVARRLHRECDCPADTAASTRHESSLLHTCGVQTSSLYPAVPSPKHYTCSLCNCPSPKLKRTRTILDGSETAQELTAKVQATVLLVEEVRTRYNAD